MVLYEVRARNKPIMAEDKPVWSQEPFTLKNWTQIVGGRRASSTHCVLKDHWVKGRGPASDRSVHTALAFSAWNSRQNGIWHRRGLQKHSAQNTW